MILLALILPHRTKLSVAELHDVLRLALLIGVVVGHDGTGMTGMSAITTTRHVHSKTGL